jgi:riboflavin kinase/FMN adenylyltransferase
MIHSTRVLTGRGEGKRIGIPTLNLDIPPGFSERQGIYAGWVTIGDARHAAAFHWGPIPSFGIETLSLEAHLLDIALAAAPQEVSFELTGFIREIKAFPAVTDLQAAIREDIRQVRRVLRLPPEAPGLL